jgi:hypothetical protein
MRTLGIILCLICFPFLLLLLFALISDEKKELNKLSPEEREKELWRMR